MYSEFPTLNYLEQEISRTHKLDAILIVSIIEIDPYVKNIMTILNGDDSNADMIKSSIASVIMDYVLHIVPTHALTGLLVAALLDNYRIHVDINKKDSFDIRDNLGVILNIIAGRMRSVGSESKYKYLDHKDASRLADLVYIPYKIDVALFRSMEFRFYGIKGGSDEANS